MTALQVNEGDVIRIHTGNGGGYGDPRRRPRELVLDDLRNGFVTRRARGGGLRRAAAGVVSPADDPFTLEIIQEVAAGDRATRCSPCCARRR